MKIYQHLSRLSAVCLLTGMLGVSAAQAQTFGGSGVDMQPTFSGQSTDSQSVMNEPGQPNAPRTINPNTPEARTVAGNTTNRSKPVLINPSTAVNTQTRVQNNSQQPQQTQTTSQTRQIQQSTNAVNPNSVPKAYRGYDPAVTESIPTPPPTINYVVESNNTPANTSSNSSSSETLGPELDLSQQDIYPYLSDDNVSNTETTRIDRSERLIYADADADDADNSNSPFNALYILLFTIIAISVVAAVYMVQRYRTEGNVRPLR